MAREEISAGGPHMSVQCMDTQLSLMKAVYALFALWGRSRENEPLLLGSSTDYK